MNLNHRSMAKASWRTRPGSQFLMPRVTQIPACTILSTQVASILLCLEATLIIIGPVSPNFPISVIVILKFEEFVRGCVAASKTDYFDNFHGG